MDWKEVFLSDTTWALVLQVAVRTIVMFVAVLLLLRASGKKGVRQLSIFEVAIIIALGSAAGDPMFYEDVAIVPCLVVFTVILTAYRLIIWLAGKSERFESIVEGKPVTIIRDGMIELGNKGNSPFAHDEFFAEMRGVNVEHMGQVRMAILETNGSVSFYYFADEEVRPGLPVIPELYDDHCETITEAGDYSCCYCGQTDHISQGRHQCKRCGKEDWVKAIATKRIT